MEKQTLAEAACEACEAGEAGFHGHLSPLPRKKRKRRSSSSSRGPARQTDKDERSEWGEKEMEAPGQGRPRSPPPGWLLLRGNDTPQVIPLIETLRPVDVSSETIFIFLCVAGADDARVHIRCVWAGP
jgi:hypothetical protein